MGNNVSSRQGNQSCSIICTPAIAMHSLIRFQDMQFANKGALHVHRLMMLGILLVKQNCFKLYPVFFLLASFLKKFELKNVKPTLKWSKFAKFRKEKNSNLQMSTISSSRQPRRILVFFLTYISGMQPELAKLVVDGQHLGYITKSFFSKPCCNKNQITGGFH